MDTIVMEEPEQMHASAGPQQQQQQAHDLEGFGVPGQSQGLHHQEHRPVPEQQMCVPRTQGQEPPALVTAT
eukprot:scaffold297817_cov14-Tisochrysis_lutea.AAC.1